MKTIIEIATQNTDFDKWRTEDAFWLISDLERMYTRYINNNDYQIDILAIHYGQLGGCSYILFITDMPYEMLKDEHKVHSMSKISAYLENKRVTSFASVQVVPYTDIEIDKKDFIVEHYRASGPADWSGKTDRPNTKIKCIKHGREICPQKKKNVDKIKQAITCLQNDTRELLKSRRYTLYPYFLIRDTETDIEIEGEQDVKAVLDGNLDLLRRQPD